VTSQRGLEGLWTSVEGCRQRWQRQTLDFATWCDALPRRVRSDARDAYRDVLAAARRACMSVCAFRVRLVSVSPDCLRVDETKFPKLTFQLRVGLWIQVSPRHTSLCLTTSVGRCRVPLHCCCCSTAWVCQVIAPACMTRACRCITSPRHGCLSVRTHLVLRGLVASALRFNSPTMRTRQSVAQPSACPAQY
jgi:hypothetical protein